MNITPVSLVRELQDHQTEHAQRCIVMRWLHSLFYLRVEQDITKDIVEHEKEACAMAHKAEVDDAEADQLIQDVLADGKVTPDEVPVLRKAQRHVQASARTDHDLTETLKV